MDGAGTVLSAEDQKKVQDVIDACPELAMQEEPCPDRGAGGNLHNASSVD